MSLISCNNLKLSYDGTVVAENLSFSVSDGDYLCIVGENGSGKSTLIKTLLGMHKPSAGSLIFDPSLKQNEIGYFPQQTESKRSFPASVFEIVLSGRLNRKRGNPFYNKDDRIAAEENMKILDISHLKNCCFSDLSGGQQQRVLLARALCATSKLILLDEPVSSLDPIATAEFYEIIAHLNRIHNITVIMVSHDIGAVSSYASHILHLSKHHSFFGTCDEYKKSDIYLGGKY